MSIEQPPKSVLDDLGEEITGIAWPVSICMAVTIFLVRVLNPEGASSASTVFIASAAYNENTHPEASSGQKLGGALLNALIFVAVVVAMTFLLVILFKYGCYRCIFGYMGFAVMNCYFLVTGLLIILLCQKGNVHIDAFSLTYILYNFSVVGTIGVLFMPIPLLMKQAYMVWVGIIVAYIFTWIPDWTSWVLLVAMALYDIASVLIPGGPLKALVEMAVERQQALPALVYESRPNGGYRGAAAWIDRRNPNGASAADPERQPPEQEMGRPRSPAAAAAAGAAAAAAPGSDAMLLLQQQLLPGSADAAGNSDLSKKLTSQALAEASCSSFGVDQELSTMVNPRHLLLQQQQPRANTVTRSGPGPLGEAKEDEYMPLRDGESPRAQPPAPRLSRTGAAASGGSPATEPLIPHTRLPSCDSQDTPGGSNSGSLPDRVRDHPLGSLGIQSDSPLRPRSPAAAVSATGVIMGLASTAVAPMPSPRPSPLGTAGAGAPATAGLAGAAPPAAPQGPQQSAEEDDFDLPDGVKLGLGDFIFYSMLVGKAAMYDMMTVYASFIGIIAGLGLTLLCLAIFKRALPALPFSIALGVLFYFLTRIILEVYVTSLVATGAYF